MDREKSTAQQSEKARRLFWLAVVVSMLVGCLLSLLVFASVGWLDPPQEAPGEKAPVSEQEDSRTN